GTDLEAVVARFDPSNAEAVSYLQRHFKSMGVYKLLKKAGARSGDDGQIGNAGFALFADTAPVTETLAQDDSERAGKQYLEDTEEPGGHEEFEDSAEAEERAAYAEDDVGER